MEKVSRRNFMKKAVAVSAGAGIASTVFSQKSSAEEKEASQEKFIFPKSFIFGAGTAAYQIEGAWNVDGKGESIWDRWTHMQGNTKYNADVACDHYNRWKEDVAIMKQLNLDCYRFSISWPRLMPDGKGKINQKGLDFYKKLTDELLNNGIKPAITLFHWDTPQKLQDLGGWANRDIVDWFADYANIMFKALGDRVPIWTTHNEPWVFTIAGHTYGKQAPGLKDLPTALLTTHNALLAHGKAVQAYRASGSKGKMGITLSTSWNLPSDEKNENDIKAANLIRRSHIEWFSDPIYKGAYPEDVWKKYADAGIPMPEIKPGDMSLIQSPIDFLGLNFYGPNVVKHEDDNYWPYGVRFLNERSDLGSNMWKADELTRMLLFISDRYNKPEMMITENGYNGADTDFVDRNNKIQDVIRKEYTYQHIKAVYDAIQQGVNMSAYLHWSFIDNFEWGTWSRMGLVYRDYANNNRIIKESGYWYANIIKDKCLLF